MTIRELKGLNISQRASALAGIIGPVAFVTSALLLYFFSLGASESFGLIGVVNRIFVMESLAWFVVMGTRSLGISRMQARRDVVFAASA